MWTCEGCGEQLEEQFDICWHCGATRGAIDTDEGGLREPAHGSAVIHPNDVYYARLWWVIAAFVFGMVVRLVYALPHGHSALEPILKSGVALWFVLIGLISLFPLAAYDRGRASGDRLRTSVFGTCQILLGVSQALPDADIGFTVSLLALTCAIAAALRIPKSVFASVPDATTRDVEQD